MVSPVAYAIGLCQIMEQGCSAYGPEQLFLTLGPECFFRRGTNKSGDLCGHAGYLQTVSPDIVEHVEGIPPGKTLVFGWDGPCRIERNGQGRQGESLLGLCDGLWGGRELVAHENTIWYGTLLLLGWPWKIM